LKRQGKIFVLTKIRLSQKTELLSARSCQPLNRLNQVFKIVCEVKQTQTENCCDGQGTQVFLRFCLVAEIVCSNNKQNKRVSFISPRSSQRRVGGEVFCLAR
jgi:hypothetical protein